MCNVPPRLSSPGRPPGKWRAAAPSRSVRSGDMAVIIRDFRPDVPEDAAGVVRARLAAVPDLVLTEEYLRYRVAEAHRRCDHGYETKPASGPAPRGEMAISRISASGSSDG